MLIVQISGLLLYLYGCSNLPTDRQSLEFISADQTGRLVVMRLTQSDTGWLKGTGHFKATIWNPGDTTLEFWDHAPKSHVDWNEQQIFNRKSAHGPNKWDDHGNWTPILMNGTFDCWESVMHNPPNGWSLPIGPRKCCAPI